MLCPLKLAPATVPGAFLIWKAMHSAVAKILQTSVHVGTDPVCKGFGAKSQNQFHMNLCFMYLV